MGKINMKGATPVTAESLCRTCTWSQITSGFRDSDRLVICTNVYPNVSVEFQVMECNKYWDKFRPSWKEMKELAIDVGPKPTRRFVQTTGFHSSVVTESSPSPEEETEEEFDGAGVGEQG